MTHHIPIPIAHLLLDIGEIRRAEEKDDAWLRSEGVWIPPYRVYGVATVDGGCREVTALDVDDLISILVDPDRFDVPIAFVSLLGSYIPGEDLSGKR